MGNNPLANKARAARPVKKHKKLGFKNRMIRYILNININIDIKIKYSYKVIYKERENEKYKK